MTPSDETAQQNQTLSARIEDLAAKSTEATLTEEERVEYEGYVRANKFMATLYRQAQKMQSEQVT